MDWETTHPHRKLFGWHLILPLVSTMIWEMSHLLTESALNSPRDLLVMHQPLQGISWLFLQSSIHASNPVGLTLSALASNVKGGWYSIKHRLTGGSLTHTPFWQPVHQGFFLCDSWGLQVTCNMVPLSMVQALPRSPTLIQPPMSVMSAFLYHFFIFVFIHSFKKY